MNRLAITCLVMEMALVVFSSCARRRPVFDRNHVSQPVKSSTQLAANAFDRSLSPPADHAAASNPDLPEAETLLALVEAANALTLEEAETLALANNPTLLQAQASIDVHKGTRTQAGLRPNPRVGYQHNEAGNNGRGGQQ